MCLDAVHTITQVRVAAQYSMKINNRRTSAPFLISSFLDITSRSWLRPCCSHSTFYRLQLLSTPAQKTIGVEHSAIVPLSCPQ